MVALSFCLRVLGEDVLAFVKQYNSVRQIFGVGGICHCTLYDALGGAVRVFDQRRLLQNIYVLRHYDPSIIAKKFWAYGLNLMVCQSEA